MKTQTRIGLAVGLTLALLVGLAPRAEAAGYEMPITFSGYTNRTETLTNFPVLVVFSNEVGSSGFNFSSHPFVTTNGYDLRFYTNTTDTGSGLNYEIESWNTNSASYVWVQVPLIPTNGMGSIFAKWGDTAASNQLACTTNGAVWTNGFAAVWHMGQTNAQDSTSNRNHGTSSNNTTAIGFIGDAQGFNGSNAYIDVGNGTSVRITGSNLTQSAWINPTGNVANGTIFTKTAAYYFQRHNDLKLGAYLQGTSPSPGYHYSTGTAPLNAWTHAAIVYDGSVMRFFLNGVESGNVAKTGPISSTSNNLRIGRDTSTPPDRHWKGFLDELRLCAVARSTNWIWAEYLNMASNTIFNTYGTASSTAATALPQIENRAPSGVTTNGATFNGYLLTNGASDASVYVIWGGTNGIVSPPWAYTNWWAAGAWTNGSYPATNMTLEANANYYYRFGATNSTTNVTATLPQSYQYLITGEVTVQPTDPTGRVTLIDSATFTVYRPSSCTNETLTVAYTLGGTATNGTHYTTSPSTSGTNGTLTIAAGQTNAVLTVNPYFQKAGEQTVVLSLVSSNYPIGSANSATCTLAAVTALPFAAVGGTVTNYIENTTNFTAHIFTSSGVFTNLVVTNIEVLVVAGGGGGGGKYHAGGGGAGGLIYSNAYPVVGNSNYTVTVGMGGAGGWGEKIRGFNGSNSAFGAIEATGGGGGGAWDVAGGGDAAGKNGGSGGGASGYSTTLYGTNLPAGQGNQGGVGGNWGGGGGGGAGSIGLNGLATAGGGAGGTGVVSSLSGVTNYYAGGGGGAGYTNIITGSSPGGAGGLGGGGQGADFKGAASNGVANTGGGGGGASGGSSSSPTNPTNGAAGGSGIVIVRYVTVSSDVPQIENRAPSGVTANGATFNGYLAANGVSDASVYVLWGGTNGIVSPPWAYTNWWAAGDWTNGSYPSTNMELPQANANYYYTFGATNSAGTVVASNAQYLITGEVTVQPTDPTGRVTLADTAAFTVYRPASCTNEAITVAYTLGGTATNGTHYTNSPAASGTDGTVTIPAGQTNAVITVYPLNVIAPEQTVALSLVSSNYALGAAISATCTLVEVTGLTYTWKVNNGLWSNAANWDPSGGPPAAGNTGVLTGLVCKADANLTGGPTIEVRTNASLYCGNGASTNFSGHTIVLNGGQWALNSGSKGIITNSDIVALESDSELRAGLDNDDQRWILSGLIRDGFAGGTGRLSINTTNLLMGNQGRGQVDIMGSNTYSGGTVIFGSASSPQYSPFNFSNGLVRVFSPGALGQGDVLVSAYGYLGIATNNTTAAGKTITVGNLGGVGLGIGSGGVTFNCQGHNFLLKDGSSLRSGMSGTVNNRVNSDDTYALEGSVQFKNYTEGQFHIYGIISNGASAGKMVVQAARLPNNAAARDIYLRNPGNTFSGGIDIEEAGYLSIATNNAYGAGPITLLGTNSYLLLDQATDADWTVTNNIAGKGTITVEAGDGVKKLTCTGTVDPGTNGAAITTNSTGILRVDGDLAFGAGSRLKIDIAGTNGVAGVDFDRLLVDHDLTGLGSATLEVAVNGSLTLEILNGLSFVVVSNASTLTSTFGSVVSWPGKVVYNQPTGTVKLTGSDPGSVFRMR